ncbi:MAG: hypothetical protein JWN93_409 [Hyphomicrobiales bacterium]|jgi:chromosome segregation ATPase|nr:hypothetical protein [Hyphomicrobiales bacterium]
MAVDEREDLEGDAPSPEVRRSPKAVLPGLPRANAQHAEPGAPYGTRDPAQDHFGDALELVRAASDALERMRARCRDIEAYATQQAEYYRGELSLAHTGIRDLQEQNLSREDAIQRLEAQLRVEVEQRRNLEEALKATSDTAEKLREQLAEAETRASSAEAWLGRFQGEIASAFGEVPRILGEIGHGGEGQQEQAVVQLRQG